MTPQTQSSLQQTVSRLLEFLDAMNLDALATLVDDEVQSIDEITRGWVRGRSAMNGYLSQLQDTVSDVRSEMSDVQEKAWGDTGLVPSPWIKPTRWTGSASRSPLRHRSSFSAERTNGRSC